MRSSVSAAIPPAENGNSNGSASVRGFCQVHVPEGAPRRIQHIAGQLAQRYAFGGRNPADPDHLIGEIGEGGIQILRAVDGRRIRGQTGFLGRGHGVQAAGAWSLRRHP